MSTPPTVPHVHDSDRKALKEIEQSCLYLEGAPSYESPFLDIEAAALIIARHHAEERAAVDGVLNEIVGLLQFGTNVVRLPGRLVDKLKALTALRTASQQDK